MQVPNMLQLSVLLSVIIAQQASINVAPAGTTGECGRTFGNCTVAGSCCSKFGYCGLTEAHCGAGCNATFNYPGALCIDPANPVARPSVILTPAQGYCGSGVGVCASSGSCCSKYGYCGNTTAYCGTGCQNSYNYPGINCIGFVPIPSSNLNSPSKESVGVNEANIISFSSLIMGAFGAIIIAFGL